MNLVKDLRVVEENGEYCVSFIHTQHRLISDKDFFSFFQSMPDLYKIKQIYERVSSVDVTLIQTLVIFDFETQLVFDFCFKNLTNLVLLCPFGKVKGNLLIGQDSMRDWLILVII